MAYYIEGTEDMQMVYQIGICDDEKSTCSELEEIILNYFELSDIEVEVSVWNCAEDLIKDVPSKVELNILFLDIELPGQSGVFVGEYIRNDIHNDSMHILYISSKTNYAMSLFKVHPYDFLVKPISKDAVVSNISHLLKLDKQDKQYFWCEFNRCKSKIYMGDIVYFESDRKHIKVMCTNGEEGKFVGKINELAAQLPFSFSMIAKSYIINLRHIRECKKNCVTMDDGQVINIGRKYKDSFNTKIIEYNKREADR